jgi:branched-chain amino acid transport system permease protein
MGIDVTDRDGLRGGGDRVACMQGPALFQLRAAAGFSIKGFAGAADGSVVGAGWEDSCRPRESLGGGLLSFEYKDAIVFGVLILILIVRPSGILGYDTGEKV